MKDIERAANPGGHRLRPAQQVDHERPYWGEIDVLLAIPWYILATLIAGIVAAVAVVVGGDNIADEPIYALFFGTLTLQLFQAAYPWLVSRRKGLGLEADWRFVSSLPGDIGYGMLLAVGCLVGAQVATIGTAALVGLDNANDASNTDILIDNKDSPWIFGFIFLVVVVAPLAEELLFRGLILRIFQKSFGTVFAVVGSTLMFTLPHIQPDASWQESVVLLSAIAVVGAVLGFGAVKTGRLGPAVIAHFLFNGAGTLLTLA